MELSDRHLARLRKLVEDSHFASLEDALDYLFDLADAEVREQPVTPELLAELQKGIDDIEAGRYTTYNSAKELMNDVRHRVAERLRAERKTKQVS